MPTPSIARFAARPALALLTLAVSAAFAQTPPPAAPAQASPPSAPAYSPDKPAAGDAKAAETGPLAPLAWLAGCWHGNVNQRDYREHWMPLRGGLLIGVSETVMRGKSIEYEYLRLEPRADGVYYIANPSGQKETAFKLTETRVDKVADRNDEIFVFTNPEHDFPKKISYRRGTEGWLYADVEGIVRGSERRVTYPMRRIDCESGEFITK